MHDFLEDSHDSSHTNMWDAINIWTNLTISISSLGRSAVLSLIILIGLVMWCFASFCLSHINTKYIILQITEAEKYLIFNFALKSVQYFLKSTLLLEYNNIIKKERQNFVYAWRTYRQRYKENGIGNWIPKTRSSPADPWWR